MNNLLKIRIASVNDAPAIAELIYSTSLACCFTIEQPCPEWFEESVAPDRIENQLESEQMAWLVAEHKQSLLGVLAVSERSHVKYFFVHPANQNLGIGKQLWQAALNTGILGNPLTVRSSLFAIPVYERLGFKIVEPVKVFNGMHYQTMEAVYS